MLKRILTIASILLLAINVCVFADETDKDYERLLNLGIIDQPYEHFANKKTVSQKEFLEALVRITTDEKIESNNVPEYAKSLGIISTINNIELNSTVSYERALNLSLNAIGYAKIIEISGNDTSAVVKLAGNAKLNSGIVLTVGDNLNGTSFIKLLNNIIEAKVVSVSLGKNDNNGYTISNQTSLYHYRNIDKIEGKVTGVQDTSLLYESGCGENKIAIDEVIYTVDYAYSQELLGQTVYVYTKEVYGRPKAYYVEAKNSEVNRTEIIDKDILSVASDFSNITYDFKDKIKTLKLNPALIVIYNGQNYTGYTVADLKPQNGSIVCIDLDNDNKYDVVYVYSYETMVVKNVSPMHKIITNLYKVPGGIDQLDLSDTSLDVRIYSEGEKVNFSSIMTNNILSVAESKGANKVITIYIGKEKIDGVLSGFDTNDNTVIVKDTEYKINNAYFDAITAGASIDSANVGIYYTYYLDAFGKIALLKRDSKDGYEYAFILSQKWRRKEDTARVRLLNLDGDWEDVYYAEKVKLNDQKRQKSLDVFNSLGGTSMEPQLVLVKRDEDGKLIAIKTATLSSKYDPNNFTKTSEYTRHYWSNDTSFNCRHYLKYDAVVLLVPNDTSKKYDEEEYDMSSTGYFTDWGTYTYTAYNVDEFGYPDALVVKDTGAADTYTMYVNKIITGLNEDDEAVKILIGNFNGLENLRIPEVPGAITATVNSGDIVNFNMRNGKITGLSVTYSPGTPKTYVVPADSSSIHNKGTEVFGDVVGIDAERNMLLIDCGTETLPICIYKSADIEIYDKDEKKFIVGAVGDIYEGNYARITMGNNQAKTVVIFP